MSRIIRWRVYKPIEAEKFREAPLGLSNRYIISSEGRRARQAFQKKTLGCIWKAAFIKDGRNSLLYSNEPFSERPLRDVKEKQRKDCCAFHREIDLVENGTNKDDGTILKTGWSKILRTWVRWCFINRFDKSFFCHFTIFSFLDLQLLRWLDEMQKTRIFIKFVWKRCLEHWTPYYRAIGRVKKVFARTLEAKHGVKKKINRCGKKSQTRGEKKN